VVEGARLESVYTGNRIAGSNPAPSAIPLSSAVSHRLISALKPAVLGHFPYPIVSRRLLLSPRKWGSEMGNRASAPDPVPQKLGIRRWRRSANSRRLK
jgi:hypothetical protein